MSRFILQRQLDRGAWFDADKFEDKDRALKHLEYKRASERIRITSYTGHHCQNMRIVEVIS